MELPSLFARLNRSWAQLLVILGLALVLFAPIVPRFKAGAVDSARSRQESSRQMLQLDMQKFEREQGEERRKLQADTALSFEERNSREQAIKEKTDRQRAALEQKYDSDELQRALLTAQASAAGTRIHLLLGWLGRLALLVGLLAMTLESEGTKQKILLIILLVAMFSSLSGINLDFVTFGHLGDNPSEMFRQLRTQ
jgi:hypothetical protein